MRRRARIGLVALGLVLALVLCAWLLRAPIAGMIASAYFRAQGVEASVEIQSIGFGGIRARVRLGDAADPAITAGQIDITLARIGGRPVVTAIRARDTGLRARIDENGVVTVPSLQAWIDRIMSAPAAGPSPYVSRDLAISFQNLRVVLDSPGARFAMTGDAEIKGGLPMRANLGIERGAVNYRGQHIDIVNGAFAMERKADGYAVTARLTGGYSGNGLRANDMSATFEARGANGRGDGGTAMAEAASAALRLTAARVQSGAQSVPDVRIGLSAANIGIRIAKGTVTAHADMRGDASARPGADFARDFVARVPGIATDPALARAMTAALSDMHAGFAGRAALEGANWSFAAGEPTRIAGAKDSLLRIDDLRVAKTQGITGGAFDAHLSGAGLPQAELRAARFALRPDGGYDADIAARARFDFAMLRGASIAATGTLAGGAQGTRFSLSSCARGAIAALRPARGALATNLRATVCPGNTPLFVRDDAGWRVAGRMRGASMGVPMASANIADGTGDFTLMQNGNAPMTGSVRLASAAVSDAMAAKRFNTVTARGEVSLNGNLVRGTAHAASAKADLGEVRFSHDLARMRGHADIAARGIAFAPEKLQPADLSPLLASLARATGRVAFTGALDWTGAMLTSRGDLNVQTLDFLTPLGQAHAVNTHIALTSLLPPATAPGQKLAIQRIDWTLPISNLAATFDVGGNRLHVESLGGGIGHGSAAIDGFALAIDPKARLASTLHLNAIDMAEIVAATNIGNKIRLEGRVSGNVPFSADTSNIRITNGKLRSDGPGRLSIDRSVWGQSGAASVGVQDFAYQALEYLSFDDMTADINSIDNGRLQIVFHIKGKTSPPQPQEARVGLKDLVNGTAFQKHIDLPGGTPVDLTLDTTLNFDQLLQSYRAVWAGNAADAAQ